MFFEVDLNFRVFESCGLDSEYFKKKTPASDPKAGVW